MLPVNCFLQGHDSIYTIVSLYDFCSLTNPISCKLVIDFLWNNSKLIATSLKHLFKSAKVTQHYWNSGLRTNITIEFEWLHIHVSWIFNLKGYAHVPDWENKFCSPPIPTPPAVHLWRWKVPQSMFLQA